MKIKLFQPQALAQLEAGKTADGSTVYKDTAKITAISTKWVDPPLQVGDRVIIRKSEHKRLLIEDKYYVALAPEHVLGVIRSN